MGENQTATYEEECGLIDPDEGEEGEDDDAETGEAHLTECRRALI